MKGIQTEKEEIKLFLFTDDMFDMQKIPKNQPKKTSWN